MCTNRFGKWIPSVFIVAAIGIAYPVWAGCSAGISALKKGDFRAALAEFSACAEKGDAEGQFEVGQLYYGNSLGEPNRREAAKWYLRAAQQGHKYAQGSIGALYYYGQGVDKDLVQAHMWLTLAADQGYTGAARMRHDLASEMTAEQITEARNLAQKWRSSR